MIWNFNNTSKLNQLLSYHYAWDDYRHLLSILSTLITRRIWVWIYLVETVRHIRHNMMWISFHTKRGASYHLETARGQFMMSSDIPYLVDVFFFFHLETVHFSITTPWSYVTSDKKDRYIIPTISWEAMRISTERVSNR